MVRIERASYRAGFVERLGEAARLPAITIEAVELPEDVLGLLDHHLLDLGGPYGDPNAGDSIQYDELRIEHDRGAVEIVVYQPRHPVVQDRQRGGGARSSGCCRLAQTRAVSR